MGIFRKSWKLHKGHSGQSLSNEPPTFPSLVMATREQKPTLIVMNRGSSFREHKHKQEEQEEEDDIYQNVDASSSGRFGGCFRLFRFRCSQSNGNFGRRFYILQKESGRNEDMTWWRKELRNKTQWKTFIRKIGEYFKTLKQKYLSSKKHKPQKNRSSHYDIHSYALNFDSGPDRDSRGDDAVSDFAARFSASLFLRQRSLRESDV